MSAKAWGGKFGRTAQHTKGIGSMAKPTEVVESFILMAMFIKVNG
jgi:hypothetical protein